MKTSVKVSLGGVIAALSLVLMLLCSVIPFGTFAFPAFAGILLTVIVINLGYGWAFAVYFVTAVLSFLLVTDKEAALYYTAFFGFYPILKSLIERLRSKVVQYVIKYVIFNVCMIAAFLIGTFLLSVPKESFNLFGVYLPGVFLAIGNVFFIIYDLCVTRLVTLYLLKWHNRLNKNTKL
ncbi:hypothetical protein [Ruminococcus sp.]|uniref:hypothetical protein n=1 Tax=Ruminococcus sp. TaxID=41978 RepID=UPI00388FEC41